MDHRLFQILIAEDNPFAADPLKRLIHLKLDRELQGIDIQVVVVTTLKEALEHTDAHTSIIDLNLVDAGPDEVIGHLHMFKPPIIVMTGETDENLHARCRQAGAEFILVKGNIRENTLISAILSCLSKSVVMSTDKIIHDAPDN